MIENKNGAAAGWKVTISVPQPNGVDAHHLWVAAIADEYDVREKLLLSDIPTDVRLEPLSADEMAQLELEPGEIRRIS
jgi:hypothetical protein